MSSSVSRSTGFQYIFLSALILLFFFAVPVSARAGHAAIDEVVVTFNPPLKVSFRVKDAFTEEIEEAVRSGLPTSFTYLLELDHVNTLWFDDDIGRVEFRHTVKYDTLKEEYEIVLAEKGAEVVRTKDAVEMKRLMTTCTAVALVPKAPLRGGRDYELRIKAELHTVEPPPLLKYVLFFMSIWDVETDWYVHEFTP